MSAVGQDGAPAPDAQQLTRVVALDGPAGSGKSTVARRTAQALGWRFVDTGATYRAVTLHVLRAGADLGDPAAIAQAAASARVDLDVDPAARRVLLDGEDVSAEIRGPAVTAAVSAVSAVTLVREQLVSLQRRLMGLDGAVVEGRDIATVVAPRAAVKVYLDASPEVRARRRADDLSVLPDAPSSAPPSAGQREPGDGLAGVEASLTRRDALDNQTNRLAPSEGAVHLDTSSLSIADVVAVLVELVRSAGLLGDEPARAPGFGAARVPASAPEEERP